MPNGQTVLTYADMDILARTVFGEARGEDWEGKIAVARVMLNRWRSTRWFAAPTLAATCQKPGQFSCWLASDPNRPKIMAVTRNEPVFDKCWSAGLVALATTDPTFEHVYHYKTAAVHPAWEDPAKLAMTLGNHMFYRDID